MSLFTLRYRDTQLKGEGGRAFPIMDYGGLIQCMEEVRNLKGAGKLPFTCRYFQNASNLRYT